MPVNKFYTATSISLIILLGYLTYQILQPFLNAIAWAVVVSIIFYPVFVFLLKYMKFRTITSVVTILLIILIIISPFSYLSFVLVDEISSFVSNLNKDKIDTVVDIFSQSKIAEMFSRIQSYTGVEGLGSSSSITDSIKKMAGTITNSISSGISNIAGMLFDFVFMLLAVFFFLKDGPDFLEKARNYLPFSEQDKSRLIAKIKDMVISTVYGGVVIALIQGVLGGTAFYFLGINSPVLWGCAMTVMSFLPLFGTFSIWGPAAGYLIIQGNLMQGVILLLYGVFIISMVDNILRPIIISGRTKMPTLAVFFSVLGGIKFFGLIGFIMGPLVLALFVSVFEIFKHIGGGEYAQQ
jgi:predicted PurR-regulated permease PerM